MLFDNFATLIFDCDGVILNSNKIKTQAFFNVTKSISKPAADDLVNYHKTNGGISRYKKFFYFQENIICKYIPNIKLNIKELIDSYSKEVIMNLIKCDTTAGLEKLKCTYKNKNWIVVSGSDEKELNYVFNKKNIAHLFEGGIYGSPESKEKIFEREIKRKNIKFPALYFGDSKYDFIAASKYDIDFIFLYGWTEFNDWRSFIKEYKINYYRDFIDILRN